MNFLIAGGHQGTSGAVSGGYIEELVVKKIADRIVYYLKEQGHEAEEPDFNLYDKIEREGVQNDLRVYNHILEIHLDSFEGARGATIFVSPQTEGISVEQTIMNRLGKHFTNRGVKRETFFTISELEKAGRNASLLEVCFISSPADMAVLNAKFEEICKDIAYGLLEGYGQPIRLTQTVKLDPIKDVTKAPDGKLYRVGLGAYSIRENAEAVLQKAKSAGFDPYLVLIDDPRK